MSETPKAAKTGSVPVPKMRRGLKGFYKDVVREMKHVTWPTPKEASRLTGVVLAVCAGIIVLLQGLAILFHEIVTVIVTGGGV
jgi:preprotein translocase subunit SecE